MSDKIIERYVGEVKRALADNAEGSMMFPKAEPFDHGVQVGKYQGLNFALELLQGVLRDDDDKERNS